jgi:hypothetical protein
LHLRAEEVLTAFRTLHMDNGDGVAQVQSRDAALPRLGAFLEEHPHPDDEIGSQEVDADGLQVGEMIVGLLVGCEQLAI